MSSCLSAVVFMSCCSICNLKFTYHQANVVKKKETTRFENYTHQDGNESAFHQQTIKNISTYKNEELGKFTRKFVTMTTSLPTRNDSRHHFNVTRKRRYNYEDKSDWNYDEEEIDYEDDKKESKTLLENLALNWQTVTLRVIQLACVVIVIGCICCVCCRKLFQNVCGGCIYCCQKCCDKIRGHDRVYRKVKEFCDQFGIKMDYETYEKMTADLYEMLEEQGVDISKL